MNTDEILELFTDKEEIEDEAIDNEIEEAGCVRAEMQTAIMAIDKKMATSPKLLMVLSSSKRIAGVLGRLRKFCSHQLKLVRRGQALIPAWTVTRVSSLCHWGIRANISELPIRHSTSKKTFWEKDHNPKVSHQRNVKYCANHRRPRHLWVKKAS